ncbi:MAG TPA: alpha/beta fold hydrolase, partial [Vicinamibacteria bacterium]|nr:alpha/beta fold hydrolase [Vicinamibacteria bacterium]
MISGSTLRAAFALSLLGAVASGAEDVQGWCLGVAPGECVQVTISGRGPDIVLIPGLFGSAFSFRRVTAPLASEGYRTIVIEPLGVGDSARPAKADYTLTAQADRVQAALEALDVKSAVLVSHSIGTSIALRLAYRRPKTVRALVSIEGGVAEEVATPGFRRAMKLAPLIKLFGGGRIIRG